ncbi:MAG TPA: response regulator transcription factor [Polyangiaceae bacterium]|nr:response regulator transcription factor [Polyangiaceae bacterium]
MDPAPRVLLVEDDRKIATLTREYLETYGLAVDWVADGDAAIQRADHGDYDVVVLDLMLPSTDGFEVCRSIRRRSHVPIIVVTARVEVADRVLGLELGADDYLTKPFSARELLARIHALVRRARGRAGPPAALSVGGLTLDIQSCTATLGGRELPLTSYEFALLRALAEHAGRVLSRERLLDLAKGGADEAFDRSIDVRISRLRHKLGDDPRQPKLLKTIRGSGYMLAGEQK